MASLLDELLVGLGFEYDPEEAKEFKKDISNTVESIKKLVRVAVAGATALTTLTIASTKASDEQGKLAFEIGETVENIDALQFALRRSGGTADGMTNSLRQLSIRAAEAARGVGSGVEAFGILGISSTDANGKLKTTSDLMIEISKNLKGLDKSRQIELADKLGIRDSIRLLQQGPKAIRELTDEARALGVTTAEDAVIAAEFQDSLTDIWQITKQVARTLSRTLAPILKKANNEFTDWWKTNKALIEQKLPEWIDKFTMALKLMSIAIGAFLAFKLVTHIAVLIGMLKGLTVATLAANAAAFLLPALLFALGVAFVALTEDAKVFFEGGESFIGDMLKKYPQWQKELEIVATIFKSIADLTITIVDGWERLFNLDFGQFVKDIPGFLGDITGTNNAFGEGVIPELQQGITNSLLNNKTTVDKIEIIIQGASQSAQQIADAVFNVFEQTSQDLNTTVDQ